MTTIWKFPLKLASFQTVEMPEGAVVLSLQDQNGRPTIWALVQSSAPKRKRAVKMVGTGLSAPDDVLSTHRFLGTYQDLEGLVNHVFLEDEAAA